MSDEEIIEVLWCMSLSENLGEAIEPILKHFGIPTMSLSALREELKKRNLRPSWAH